MSEESDFKVAVDATVAEKVPSVVVSKSDIPSRIESMGILSRIVRTITHFFFDTVETLVVALSIFVVVYLFVAQPHEVKGSSMEPSFYSNEYILTDKLSYKFRSPERGDVIVFKSPTNPDLDYIKRVIGLPGDKVKVEKGYVYVNGLELQEPYLKDQTFLSPSNMLKEGVEITVPEGFYFAMGDNRPNSSDSREFGPISGKSIVGRAIFRYWPISELGLVSHVTY